MDRGAWWATAHGVAKTQTRLSDCTFTVDDGCLPVPSGFTRPNSFSLCENPVRSTLSLQQTLTSTGSPLWIQSTMGQKIHQENENSRKLQKAKLEFAAQWQL